MGPVPHRPLTKRSLTWARALARHGADQGTRDSINQTKHTYRRTNNLRNTSHVLDDLHGGIHRKSSVGRHVSPGGR